MAAPVLQMRSSVLRPDGRPATSFNAPPPPPSPGSVLSDQMGAGSMGPHVAALPQWFIYLTANWTTTTVGAFETPIWGAPPIVGGYKSFQSNLHITGQLLVKHSAPPAEIYVRFFALRGEALGSAGVYTLRQETIYIPSSTLYTVVPLSHIIDLNISLVTPGTRAIGVDVWNSTAGTLTIFADSNGTSSFFTTMEVGTTLR